MIHRFLPLFFLSFLSSVYAMDRIKRKTCVTQEMKGFENAKQKEMEIPIAVCNVKASHKPQLQHTVKKNSTHADSVVDDIDEDGVHDDADDGDDTHESEEKTVKSSRPLAVMHRRRGRKKSKGLAPHGGRA
jgi:hypothetical protein